MDRAKTRTLVHDPSISYFSKALIANGDSICLHYGGGGFGGFSGGSQPFPSHTTSAAMSQELIKCRCSGLPGMSIEIRLATSRYISLISVLVIGLLIAGCPSDEERERRLFEVATESWKIAESGDTLGALAYLQVTKVPRPKTTRDSVLYVNIVARRAFLDYYADPTLALSVISTTAPSALSTRFKKALPLRLPFIVLTPYRNNSPSVSTTKPISPPLAKKDTIYFVWI